MEDDAAARVLDEIGQILAEDTEYPLEGTLLYAQVDTNMVGASIFKLREEDILYRLEPFDALTEPLLQLWELGTPGKRWAEMEYVIRDGRFTATFTYPEAIDQGEDDFHRRDRIVWRHLGQKPITYPPHPGSQNGLTFEL